MLRSNKAPYQNTVSRATVSTEAREQLKVMFKFSTSIKAIVIEIEGDQKERLLSKLTRRQKEIVNILEQMQKDKASEITGKLSESVLDRTLRFHLATLKKTILLIFASMLGIQFGF